MRILLLTLLIMAVFTAVFSGPPKKYHSCSPWLGLCHVTEDCCRHLECLTYQAKCVPKSGIIIPGQDKRPIGDGPFPPGYPNN